MKIIRTCGKCWFWDEDDGEDSPGMGLCRRNPPAFAVNNDWNSVLGVWPPTQKDAWCGEYKEKKEPSSKLTTTTNKDTDTRWR